MDKLIEWLDGEHWTIRALRSFGDGLRLVKRRDDFESRAMYSIGKGLRLAGGAVILLYVTVQFTGGAFYLLYLAALNPWYFLHPLFWVALIYLSFFAAMWLLYILGNR